MIKNSPFIKRSFLSLIAFYSHVLYLVFMYWKIVVEGYIKEVTSLPIRCLLVKLKPLTMVLSLVGSQKSRL